MSKKEFGDNLHHDERYPLVKRFETMLKNDENLFFDHYSFEKIIEHYEDLVDLNKGLIACNIALEQYPFSALFLLKKAEMLFEQKEYAAAMDFVQQSAIYDPADIRVYLLQSDIYQQTSRFEKALEVLDLALEHADKDEIIDVYMEKADVYEEWEKPDEMLAYLRKAIRLNPNHNEAQSRYQFVCEIHDREEEAVKFLKRLINDHPYSYLSWYNMGNAYFNLDKLDEAIDAYEYTLAIKEDFEIAYRDCGQAWFEKKNYDKAIEYFNESVALDNKIDESFYYLGRCYSEKEMPKKALYYYRKAVSLDKEYADAWYYLSKTYLQMERLIPAFDSIKMALDKVDDASNYNIQAAKLSLKLENNDVALIYLNKIKDGTEIDLEPFLEVARIFMQQDWDEHCIEMLIDVEQKDKTGNREELMYHMAACYYKLGQKQKAAHYLGEGLDMNFDKHYMLFEILPYLSGSDEVLSIIDSYRN